MSDGRWFEVVERGPDQLACCVAFCQVDVRLFEVLGPCTKPKPAPVPTLKGRKGAGTGEPEVNLPILMPPLSLRHSEPRRKQSL